MGSTPGWSRSTHGPPVRSSCSGRAPSTPISRRAPGGCPRAQRTADGAAGKAIVYATHDTDAGDTSDWPARGIRDVPHPGERIAAGNPICTLLATGPTPEAVVAELDDRAAALRAELGVHAVA